MQAIEGVLPSMVLVTRCRSKCENGTLAEDEVNIATTLSRKSALGFIDRLKADVDRIGDALKPI
jgi:hypothetical protein